MMLNDVNLSVFAIVALAAACAPAVPTAGQTAFLRFTSAPLSRSVRNESDAAIDRACDWLLVRQSPDGSWEGDADTTAICLLALAGDGAVLPPAIRPAINRALDWLSEFYAPLREGGGPEGAGGSIAPATWPRIALAVSGRLPPSDLPELPPCPASGASEAERAFWFAHAVNRALGGELPETRPVGAVLQTAPPDADWRAPLAGRWTSSQEIDERGRGHWRSSIRDTAFAILLLKEL